MRDRLPLLALALALVVGTLAVLVLRASSRGEFAEAFSSYRSEPDGARALFLLAQQAGLPVERRHVDLEAIEGEPELVLLGVEGDAPEKEDEPDAGAGALDRWERGRVGRYETEAILKAVDRGATLIYAVTRDHPFLADLGLAFTPAPDHLSRTLTPFSPSPLTADVATLQTRISGYLSVAAASLPDGGAADAAQVGALPVLIDRHGDDRAVALLLKRGKGRVLAISAPTMASNRELAQGDAARFWLDALQDLAPPHGHIEFDEYHHGFTGERSVMAYAARYGLPWAIAQGLFALVLWMLAMRRFGAVQALRERTQRATADYLLAMARIYRLGGHRQHAAAALVRGTTRALAGFSRSRAREAKAVVESLEAAGHPELARELRKISRQTGAELDEGALLRLAESAAKLRAAAADHVQPSPGENDP